jgi:predicted transcriptional regulator
MADSENKSDLLAQTVQIVASFVSHNTVAVGDLPRLIEQTHAALRAQSHPGQSEPEKPRPAVPVKKSITPDFIICLEDGKKLKMLKRHLMTAYNLTPEQYREKWDLPPEYPMVAPNYAAKRSELARKIGLGAKGGRRRKR